MIARKLLIADSNEAFRTALSQRLCQYHYVCCCSTGTMALALSRQQAPDILVLDLMLDEIDGLSVLKTLCAEGRYPQVLIVSSYIPPYISEMAQELGVKAVFLKTTPLDILLQQLEDMGRYLSIQTNEQDRILDMLLLPLGFSAQDLYYPKLKDTLVVLSRDLAQHLGKEVYPPICARYQISIDALDSGLHRLITHSWRRGQQELWLTHFPGAVKKPPCNKIFLKRMAMLLRGILE